MTADTYTASCFDCRYPLDGLPSNACPECGRPFDPDDAATFNRILDDPVELTRRPLANAVVLRMTLEREGIPAALHERTGGVIMYAPIPVAAIFVNRNDREDAQAFMRLFDASDEPTDADAGPWTCPNCSEHIDAQFDICWNCGTERPLHDS